MKSNLILVVLTLLFGMANAHDELLYQHLYDDDNVHKALAMIDDGQGNTCLAGEFANTITLESITLTTGPLLLPGNSDLRLGLWD